MAALQAVVEARRVHPKERLLLLRPKVLWKGWVHPQPLGQQHSQGNLRAGSQVAVPNHPADQTELPRVRPARAMEVGPSCLNQQVEMADVAVVALRQASWEELESAPSVPGCPAIHLLQASKGVAPLVHRRVARRLEVAMERHQQTVCLPSSTLSRKPPLELEL